MIRTLISDSNRYAMRIVAYALAFIFLGGCQGILLKTLGASSHSNTVISKHDLIFDATHGLALDVYSPVTTHTVPVVVFFYGGSWQSGKHQWYRYVGETLAAHGVMVIIPDYRKYPKVRFPDFVEDAAKAVQWTFQHASEFSSDSQHIFLMGHSAGAHIAALLATDAQYLAAVGLQPRDLAGFIGLAGPYDFAPIEEPDLDLIPIFGAVLKDQQKAMPINFVNGDEPPALLLHGALDEDVLPSESQRLEKRLVQAGDKVELKEYPGIGHTKILLALAPRFQSMAPVLDDILRFIAKHS